jgi:hypothetical protein
MKIEIKTVAAKISLASHAPLTLKSCTLTNENINTRRSHRAHAMRLKDIENSSNEEGREK